MQINELYKLLGITKENLRYYEKEGLIRPQRKANGYRDYSEEDVEQLKKVLLLRRIGVPVADIRDVLEKRKDLETVLSETADHLDQQIADMQEARELCIDLKQSSLTIDEIDPDAYLEKISEKQNGFMDLTKDVLHYSADLFVDSFGHFQFFFPVFKPLLWKRKRKGSAALAWIFLALFILNGGVICHRASMRNNMTSGHYFLRGMLVFALIVIVWIMLRNIVWLLSRRFPEAEKPVIITGSVLSALVSFFLVFLAVFHWSRIWMFTPYEGAPVFLDETADCVKVMQEDELGSEENGWTDSERSKHYDSSDRAYNEALRDAVLACEPTGKWSATADRQTLLKDRKVRGIPEEFFAIEWISNASNRSTVFFLIHDPDHAWFADPGSEWYVDEPNYGIYRADDQLVRLVQEYDQHITLNEGIRFRLRSIFEYDPERVWKDSMYKDGRFDTYHYLTLTDRETGEDVTESFIAEYMEAYEKEEWETLLSAMETVKESWEYVYVNPEAAHMEGSN